MKLKKRLYVSLMVMLNANGLSLASSELSTVHDWIRAEYGEKALLSVLSDLAAGYPGAITTWDASKSETNLASYIAEAYCRYVISDEALYKAKQLLSVSENWFYGVPENFSLRGIQYSEFTKTAIPFSWVIRSVRTNAVNYCAIVHRATVTNQHVKFVVYVNTNNGKADLRFFPPSLGVQLIGFYSFPMLLRKERHFQYQLLELLKTEDKQKPVANDFLDKDIEVEIIENL
jgi:hypothetical protein